MRYDYRCPACETVREESHGMTEDPVVTCECGEQMHRLISGGLGTRFKGDDWDCKKTRWEKARAGAPLRPTARSKGRVISAAGVAPGNSDIKG